MGFLRWKCGPEVTQSARQRSGTASREGAHLGTVVSGRRRGVDGRQLGWIACEREPRGHRFALNVDQASVRHSRRADVLVCFPFPARAETRQAKDDVHGLKGETWVVGDDPRPVLGDGTQRGLARGDGNWQELQVKQMRVPFAAVGSASGCRASFGG